MMSVDQTYHPFLIRSVHSQSPVWHHFHTQYFLAFSSETPKKVWWESVGQILFRNNEGVRKGEGLESRRICVVKGELFIQCILSLSKRIERELP